MRLPQHSPDLYPVEIAFAKLEACPRGAYFVGGPTEVAEKILAAHEQLKFDRILLEMGLGIIEHRSLLEAIEILGARVIPEVRRGLLKSS